jgi:predicted dehydrogenase
MKICVVGLGQAAGYSRSYWDALKPELIHFVDLDGDIAREWSENYRSKHTKPKLTYSTELPSEAFDFAIINTPSSYHIDQARHFLEWGAKVFIEKPPCLARWDIEWIERNPDEWITVGFQCRFNEAVTLLRDRFRDPILVEVWKHRGRPVGYYDDWHGDWSTDGGVICQQGIHCVDLICSLTEENPTEVQFIGQNNKHLIEAEDTAALLLRYDGWTAVIHATTAMNVSDEAGLKVVQREGVMSIGGSAFDQIERWPWAKQGAAKAHGYKKMWQVIAEALESGGPPPVPATEAVRAMKIVHAGYSDGQYGSYFEPLGAPA